MITYDFAFCTKYRYDVIKPEMVTTALQLIDSVAGGYNAAVIATPEVELDFVHVRVSCPEATSPVELLGVFKGTLSIGLQGAYPEVKARYYGKMMFDRSFFRTTTAATEGELVAWKNEHPKH